METEILYVSPHLDDVLLSMAQNIKNEIANNANVTIATFFSEGNTQTRSLYESRRKDDVCAISKIGAKAMHIGFTDSYFRDSRFCNYSSIMFHKECTKHNYLMTYRRNCENCSSAGNTQSATFHLAWADMLTTI